MLAALIALEGLATIIDLVAGHHGVLHWEERVNARNGALFACGHLEHWPALQYRTFCGGCTAQGLIAAPVFRLIGASIGSWKLVVVAFHMTTVILGCLLARRLAGPRAAIAACLLLMAAPGFYRELALTGWGNHAEASVFPLAAALVLDRGVIGALGSGLAMGLGIWFAPITAHAVPAILALTARSWIRFTAFACGLGLGLLPVLAFLQARPAGVRETGELWASRELASPGELLGFLSGEGIGGGLWSAFEYGDLAGLGVWWWGLLWSAALWGVALQARRNQPLRGLLVLALTGLVGAFAVRHDLWEHLPEFPDHPAFNLRYLAPLVPWLIIAASVTQSPQHRSIRLTLPVLGLLICTGMGLRASSWSDWQPAQLADPIVTQSERIDRTMPLGSPPQPNRRMQGRPQDLEAGLAWLSAHQDPLETCRAMHLAELGRRLGRSQDPSPWIQRALSQAETPTARALLADGVARSAATTQALRLPQLGALADEVAFTWGKIHAPDYRGRTPLELTTSLPVPVIDGICAARKKHRSHGRKGLRPGWHLDDPGDLAGCAPR
jgi:hypothetical protein